MTTVVPRLLRAEFFRGVLVIGGGTLIAQFLPIVLTPVLTRIYSPQDLGMLGIYTAFISFASSVTSLGYSQAIVSAKDDEEATHLLILSALLILPLGLAGSGLLLLLHTQSWLGFGELPVFAVMAMFVSLVLTGAYFSLRYWLVRIERYADISRSTIVQSVGRVLSQVTWGVMRPSSVGLIVAEIIGRAMGLGRMWTRTRESLRLYSLSADRHSLVRVARDYRKFPLYSTPATLLDSLGPALHVPLISAVFGFNSAGQYSVANQVLMVPAVFLGASVADVFHSRMARYAREAPERASRFFYQVAAILFSVGFVPTVLLMLYGSEIFPNVLGKQWGTSGIIAGIMAPRVLTLLVVNPLSRVVLIYQGQELKLIYNSVTAASIAIIYAIADRRDWDLMHTLTIYTWWQVVLHAFYFGMLLYIIRRPVSAKIR